MSGTDIVVTATVVQTGDTEPTIAAGEGWTMTTPVSKDNPDEGYIEWTFECSKDAAGADPA